ncbi:MAG: hypothetical protein COU27_03135 [Candidatus Levybacteria bacterium CG10_big_fil_rev_8_21_14_0_10_36_7]|nr:MAG: hypothetical protein COU27_03135 [Candidatus Levybacteria bacterium CG10_big_fil_rev_8_21_14_0_10_36_7]
MTNEARLEINETGLGKRERELKTLFALSFPHSQGDSSLQINILQWLTASGYITNSDLIMNLPDEFFDIKIPNYHQGSAKLMRTEEKINLARESWEALTEFFLDGDEKNDEDLLSVIAEDMIETDIVYQEMKRKRKKQTQTAPLDSVNDSHASFVRKFIVTGDNPGHAAYADLYRKIAPLIQNDEKLAERMNELKTSWEKNHPEETFYPKHTNGQ